MIGAGGHAAVLTDILLSQGRNIIAVISHDNIITRSVFKGIQQLKNDDDILEFDKNNIRLVNGIGMLPKSSLKRKLNEYYLSLGYQYSNVIANSAVISKFAELSEGIQVLPNAVIQSGVKIGIHSTINTGVIIEHDSVIGEYNHIAPGAVICGQVITESSVFVGANSTIIQNLSIGHGSIIGAGTLVNKILPSNHLCIGSNSIIKKIEI